MLLRAPKNKNELFYSLTPSTFVVVIIRSDPNGVVGLTAANKVATLWVVEGKGPICRGRSVVVEVIKCEVVAGNKKSSKQSNNQSSQSKTQPLKMPNFSHPLKTHQTKAKIREKLQPISSRKMMTTGHSTIRTHQKTRILCCQIFCSNKDIFDAQFFGGNWWRD